jgi:hypothetical protein
LICERAYARGGMLTHAFGLAGDHRAAFSIVPVGNQIDAPMFVKAFFRQEISSFVAC